jgi:hypothetical protein
MAPSHAYILRARANPFEDAGFEKMRTQIGISAMEPAKTFPRNGEPVTLFSFNVESSGPEETTPEHTFGNVIRTDADFGDGSPVGTYWAMSLKSWGCGAPVVNSRGVVVGVCEHADESPPVAHLLIAAPTPYILDMLRRVESRHQAVRLEVNQGLDYGLPALRAIATH